MAEGTKYDAGKPRLELIPFDALEEVAAVMAFGAAKYGDRNWEKGFNFSRIIGSLLRHITAWGRGEDLDPESGLSHMAHAACNALFLLAFSLRKTGVDDRWNLSTLKKSSAPTTGAASPSSARNVVASGRLLRSGRTGTEPQDTTLDALTACDILGEQPMLDREQLATSLGRTSAAGINAKVRFCKKSGRTCGKRQRG